MAEQVSGERYRLLKEVGVAKLHTPSLLLLLAILLATIARVRVLGVPLERDEGEYGYMGQLMLQGIAPYKLGANMKLPGTSAAYAVVMAIFGQTATGIHLGLLAINLASVVLIYFIGRRLFDARAGLASSASYAVLSLSPGVLGIWAHATHFVVLPALGGTLLLLKWKETRGNRLLVWSGLLFGIAFLMKQPGICFFLFGAAFLMWMCREHPRTAVRRLTIFSSAAALPFGVLCFLLWRAGVFERFWFWVFTYGRLYGAIQPIFYGFAAFITTFPAVVIAAWPIWILAAIGFRALWKNQPASEAKFLTMFLGFSFLAVCPGLYFRSHYFVLLLPAVALLAGVAWTKNRPDNPRFAWLAAAAVLLALLESRSLFRETPLQISRRTYGTNPFPEAVEVGSYIKSHSSSTDRIAVIGSEPEMIFYSVRHSATPYIYVYALMEPHPYALRMQQEFIRDVEAAEPEYLVVVNVPTSFLRQPSSPALFFEWFPLYIRDHYMPVGLVDIRPDGSVYKWGAQAASLRDASSNSVVVYKKAGK